MMPSVEMMSRCTGLATLAASMLFGPVYALYDQDGTRMDLIVLRRDSGGNYPQVPQTMLNIPVNARMHQATECITLLSPYCY
jgi:hypothetical protein